MSTLLVLLLLGGLLLSFRFYRAAHDFVLTSQLPIFPSTAAAAEELPPPATDITLAPPPAPADPPVEAPIAGADSEGEAPAPEQEAPVGEQAPLEVEQPVLPPPTLDEGEVAPVATERLTVLVMGIDRREAEDEEDGPWRTDSMLLLSIDPMTERVAMLSVPRDLFITLPDHGFGERRDRINTAYYYGDFYEYPGGGAALAKQTIRRNFGIEVDRYLVMDFNGFRQIIDYVGGVWIDVPELLVDHEYPTEDYGIMTVRFEPGRQLMGGERALIYSRTRKSTSDFARAQRQQEVVMALRDRVLSLDIIPSLTPANVAGLIRTVNKSIATDLTADEVLAFAQVARDIQEDDIHRLVIDHTMVSPYWTNQGAEVLLPDWEQIIPLLEETFDTTLLPRSAQAPLPPPMPSATPTRIWPTSTPRPRWTPTPVQPMEPPEPIPPTWTPEIVVPEATATPEVVAPEATPEPPPPPPPTTPPDGGQPVEPTAAPQEAPQETPGVIFVPGDGGEVTPVTGE